MATEDSNPPLPVYNYTVEIDGIPIAFNKVDGLDIEYATPISYAESPITSGSPGPRTIQVPGKRKPPDAIKLDKGVLGRANFEVLYGWINSIQATFVIKKDISVRHNDHNGVAVISWKAINAFPTKLEAPDFDVTDDKVAIQSMTLQADRVVMELA
jgi:phage tail-like protein